MKISCDVCTQKEASVFCSADEASLCVDCDRKVHQANKLASKHPRFSLLQTTFSDFPLCDVCQVKKALLFCQQDRAILCRDCDVSIHTANEHTQKHNRFLLTGIKLSSIDTPSSASAAAAAGPGTKRLPKSGCADPIPDFNSHKNVSTNMSPVSSGSSEITSSSIFNSNGQTTASKAGTSQFTTSGNGSSDGSGSTSSISEYLIDMLPGWQVEDLLDSSFGFCKGSSHDPLCLDPTNLPIRDATFQNIGLWVPEAPLQALPQPSPFGSNLFEMVGFLEGETGGGQVMHKKPSRKKMKTQDGFAVPQISRHPFGSMRSRPTC